MSSTIVPDGSCEMKSVTPIPTNNVAACAVFYGAHTGPGSPCEPTGKATSLHPGMVLNELGLRLSGDSRTAAVPLQT